MQHNVVLEGETLLILFLNCAFQRAIGAQREVVDLWVRRYDELDPKNALTQEGLDLAHFLFLGLCDWILDLSMTSKQGALCRGQQRFESMGI